MHSALRPYMTAGLAIVGSSVIALAPVAPPAPAQGAATPTKQVTTRPVTLSAKVITINPSSDSLDMSEQLNGVYCQSPNTCYELEYRPVWTSLGQFGYGVEALQEALAGSPGEDITIFGFSEGAVVASQWLEAHLADPEAYPAPENLTFVVIGNPNRKYGGSGTAWGELWPESPYKVIDVVNQYDPTADQPANPFNVLSVLNATMGFFTNHLGNSYEDVDLDDPANSRWEEDGIEYVFVPSKTLPLLAPLRWLGLTDLADELDAPLRYAIEQGYNRDPRVQLPASTAGKSIFNVPINLLEMVGNMPYNAVAGTNRFANAMRASGSWWVYTPTNVLGWDPANPEMTRAFVDFLIAIPSISTPMGEIADYWARANLPMSAGCSGFPPCDDPSAITDQMFKAMIWDLFSEDGYTFTSPTTPEFNPISANEGYWGQELGEVGDPVEWYGETIYLEPFADIKSFWNYLISPPEGIKSPTASDSINAFKNLASALTITFNPFVPQSSVWNPKMTPFAYLARPLAKILCPDCNKVDPFMPPSWEVGDAIPKGAYIPPSVKDQYDEDGQYIGPDADADVSTLALTATEEEVTEEEATEEATEEKTDDVTEEKTDVVSGTIESLLKKFKKAPAETPTAEEVAEETPSAETPSAETPSEETEVETETETAGGVTPTVETAEEQTPEAEPKTETADTVDENADEADADKSSTLGTHRESGKRESRKSEEASEEKKASEDKADSDKTDSDKTDDKDTANGSAGSTSNDSGSGSGGADE